MIDPTASLACHSLACHGPLAGGTPLPPVRLVLQDHKRLPGRFFARLSGASGDRLQA